VAFVGLLKAVERFDPGRNLEFSTFATATIEGRVEAATFATRPGRSGRLAVARSSTCGSGRRWASCRSNSGVLLVFPRSQPTSACTEDEVLDAMDAGGVPPVIARRSPRRLGIRVARERDRIRGRGLRAGRASPVVEELLAGLPNGEQTIVRLRFFEDMGQAEIAAQVGISQMHVSRLLARTWLQLREELQQREA
jgi:RNA polymerase sigma-B factor